MKHHDKKASAIDGTLHDDLLVGQMDNPYKNIHYRTQDEMSALNRHYEATRAQRIRAAMFPETIDDDQYKDAFAADIGQATNVHRLAEPAQMLKDAIANLIAYQDDAECAIAAVPELIRLLQDQDPIVVGHAASMVYDLSKRESARHAIMDSADLVHAVIATLAATTDEQTAKYCAGILYNISNHESGLKCIFRTGGIPVLVRMLGSPIDAVVYYSITTLHNLIIYMEGAKQEVKVHRGVEAMTPLIARPHGRQETVERFVALLNDCLYLLAVQDLDSKALMYETRTPEQLVEIMATMQYPKALYTTSRLIKVLAVEPNNKAAIVQSGGVQVLQRHLESEYAALVKHVLYALRNLSDAATNEENMEPLVKILLYLLASDDEEVVVCSAGTLSNLTCNNQRNKQTIVVCNGIETLVECLRRYSQHACVSEPLVCTLRHVTSRHDYTEQARNAVRMCQGIPLTIELLASASPPVSKAALGLVQNLAGCSANLAPLRDYLTTQNHSVTMLTGELLRLAMDACAEAAARRAPLPVWEGVQVLSIVEAAVGALQMLARDAQCRRQMQTLIPLLVQLLAYDHEPTQRAACSTLLELAQDEPSLAQMERENAASLLLDMLRSENIAIRSYAAGLLTKLVDNKPQDFKNRVETAIAEALGDLRHSDPRQLIGQHSPYAEYRDSTRAAPTNGHKINDDLYHDMTYETQQGAYDSTRQAPPGGWYDTDL